MLKNREPPRDWTPPRGSFSHVISPARFHFLLPKFVQSSEMHTADQLPLPRYGLDAPPARADSQTAMIGQ
ncbi:hypothetical protein L2E82_53725 [Cichorium intybus]|nr:hypothetical protein L2E82_53725 [Cichorium intybus]